MGLRLGTTGFSARLRFTTLGLLVAVAVGGSWPAASFAQPEVERPVEVVGSVVDAAGAPLPGVDVVLRRWPAPYERDVRLLGHDPVRSGEDTLRPGAVDRDRSDVDGVFRVAAPDVGPYRLEVHAGSGGSDGGTAAAVHPLLPLEGPAVLPPFAVPRWIAS